MIKIESLKDYIGKDNFEEITKQIYNITDFSSDYPNYESWFFSKQVPRVLEKTGEIFFVKSTEDNKSPEHTIDNQRKSSDNLKDTTLILPNENNIIPIM